MPEPNKKRLRCAVYTRKSHEEGLEQDYNSIVAQKDAGHACIASQRNEGWTPVDNDYDDPAYSGGTLERPALQRLMTDIEAGKIDVVVVYKIDRLTRSLSDFMKIIDVFEQYNVSFVSVTQQFNTTNSMGRLMLNILLSFAQFEREVTSERIRDKFAASKKKGIWMGGVPPLGYDVKDRCLVINKKEAKTVRRIFKRFAETQSATALYKELHADGVTSKSWTTQNGRFRAGKPVDRGLIYKILHNRTYLGELRHRKQWVQGRHDAIIDQALWKEVHAILSENGRRQGAHARAKIPFLLRGMVFGMDGHAFTCWHTTKKQSGKRYRYYISARNAKEHAGTSGLPKFAAAALESTVIGQIRRLLKAPPITAQVALKAQERNITIDEAQVTVALNKVDNIWDQLFPDEQSRIVQLLVKKIVISPDGFDIRMRPLGFEKLAFELTESATESKQPEAV